MKQVLLLISFCLCFNQLQAQLFGRQDLSVQQGIISFTPAWLGNKSNTNNRTSVLTELNRHYNFSRFSSVSYGAGIGTYRNPDTLFRAWDNSDFFRVKLGILLHLPQNHTAKNWSPRPLNPFISAGYHFDIMDKHYRETMGSSLSSAFRIGAGAVVKINHYWGLICEIAHNQRVSRDYRSYLQYNLGVVINFDKPYIPY